MITPHHVNFEFAKFLKEKGFQESCRDFYLDESFKFDDIKYGDYTNHNANDKKFSAPEHWQVLDWLTTNHTIHVFADCKIKKGIASYWWNIKGNKLDRWSKHSSHFNSPNDAIDAAFNYIRENI